MVKLSLFIVLIGPFCKPIYMQDLLRIVVSMSVCYVRVYSPFSTQEGVTKNNISVGSKNLHEDSQQFKISTEDSGQFEPDKQSGEDDRQFQMAKYKLFIL